MAAFSLRFVPISLVSVLLAGAAAGAEPTALDSLIANPPFALGGNGNPGRNDAANPLEFRGVLYEGNTPYFNIFEAAGKHSTWVELNEPGLNFAVKSYDAANARVQVEFLGHVLSLPLVQGPKVARPPTQIVQAPPPPGPNGAPTVATPGASGPNPDLPAQIAEEIRRRRALRQQGGNPQSQPQPAPGQPPR